MQTTISGSRRSTGSCILREPLIAPWSQQRRPKFLCVRGDPDCVTTDLHEQENKQARQEAKRKDLTKVKSKEKHAC